MLEEEVTKLASNLIEIQGEPLHTGPYDIRPARVIREITEALVQKGIDDRAVVSSRIVDVHKTKPWATELEATVAVAVPYLNSEDLQKIQDRLTSAEDRALRLRQDIAQKSR